MANEGPQANMYFESIKIQFHLSLTFLVHFELKVFSYLCVIVSYENENGPIGEPCLALPKKSLFFCPTQFSVNSERIGTLALTHFIGSLVLEFAFFFFFLSLLVNYSFSLRQLTIYQDPPENEKKIFVSLEIFIFFRQNMKQAQMQF